MSLQQRLADLASRLACRGSVGRAARDVPLLPLLRMWWLKADIGSEKQQKLGRRIENAQAMAEHRPADPHAFDWLKPRTPAQAGASNV
jgi:hypothetical protein